MVKKRKDDLFDIKKSQYDLWRTPKYPSKPLLYKDLLKAVKKAIGKGLENDIILPVVFPNALGITREDFKRVKKTKAINTNTRRIRKKA